MENFMRLRRNKDSLTLDLIGAGINTVEFDIHMKLIKSLNDFQNLFINIKDFGYIDNDVINKFKKMKTVLRDKNICFYNVDPINNSILNLFGIDKLFQFYINKQDAIEGKNPIVNRKFSIV